MHSRPTQYMYTIRVYKIHFSESASAASVKPQGAAMNSSVCGILNLENKITSTEKRKGIGNVYECKRASVTTLLCLPFLGHAAFQVYVSEAVDA